MGKTRTSRVTNEYEAYIEDINLIPTTPCYYCKHLKTMGRGLRPDEEDRGVVPKSSCKAFPNGIPHLIYHGQFPHTMKYPKQKNDVLYEPDPPTITLDGIKYGVGWEGVPEEII